MKTHREIWDASEGNRALLAEAIGTEPLRSALQVLVMDGLPKSFVVPSDELAANALLNTRREGFYEFYRALLSLTEEPPEPLVQSTAGPWEHVKKRQPDLPTQTALRRP